MRYTIPGLVILTASVFGGCDPGATVHVAVTLDGSPARRVPVTFRCPPNQFVSIMPPMIAQGIHQTNGIE
jgi:hypothetical protein